MRALEDQATAYYASSSLSVQTHYSARKMLDEIAYVSGSWAPGRVQRGKGQESQDICI